MAEELNLERGKEVPEEPRFVLLDSKGRPLYRPTGFRLTKLDSPVKVTS